MAEELEEVQVVTITGDDGSEEYYAEAAMLDIDGKTFAILVPFHDEEDEPAEDEEAIIARLDKEENGEVVYVAPTDEEFEAVAHAYEHMSEADTPTDN
ncbi:MAG: DUF1292 domain-containing protein [Megasphaera sp.]|jgi:uncharacterized protein YrzB (UPF0473 family)|nr:DUF1292 domain-containing protein [Megasphaera sp.]MCH4187602.1 DUF1292 domain-containing protein [Megasphaera sp.]MCH4217853.1 DUF1292 domain-containing protein [Megasphaera sp.]